MWPEHRPAGTVLKTVSKTGCYSNSHTLERSCTGKVILITHQPEDSVPEADLLLLDQDEPQAIVKWILSKQERKAG